MKVALYLSLIINLLGASQALMVGLVIFFKSQRNRLNTIIAGIMLTLAAVLINTSLVLAEWTEVQHYYQYFANSVVFLLGPLFYFLVTEHATSSVPKHGFLLHSLPAMVYLILSLLLSINFTLSSTVQLLPSLMIPWLWNVQTLIYLLVIYWLLRSPSFKTNSDTPWIVRLVISFAAIWSLNLLLMIVSRTIVALPDIVLLNVTLLLTVIVGAIIWRSQGLPLLPARSTALPEMGTEQKVALITQINALIEERIYTDANLRLAQFAERLSTNQRVVSAVIREAFDQNFNEFINQHRVKEVNRRLDENATENYTIMGLASEAGFLSNSAFYKAFKAYTGHTPKQYLSNKGVH
jgi:AraC-like DNA-binding protein